MTKYWISIRKVQGDQFIDEPELGATRYLRVPDGEVPAPAHQIPMAQWTREIIASFPKVDGCPTGDLLFFVHGYNISVADVDHRHKLIQAGLAANQFSCLVVSFDWPSGQTALAYLADRDHARMTAIRLVNTGIKLFVRAQDQVCDISVHTLAHSMGAFVVREAFDHADDGMQTSANWTVGQLVLIAGDVSAKSFFAGDPESDSTYRHCYRLTNFFSGYDEVLQISNVKRVGLAPRVGRVGLPPDVPQKAVNVDCSDYFHRTYGTSDLTPAFAVKSHSWYFSDAQFLKDLSTTLRGNVDRNYIATRTTGERHAQILQ